MTVKDVWFFHKIVGLVKKRDMDLLSNMGSDLSELCNDKEQGLLGCFEGYNDEEAIYFLVDMRLAEERNCTEIIMFVPHTN